MEIRKKSIRNRIERCDESDFSTVADLREWINDERFNDEDKVELYAEHDDDESYAYMEILRIEMESDADFATRFNLEMLKRTKREAEQRIARQQQFLQLKSEFEPQEIVGETN